MKHRMPIYLSYFCVKVASDNLIYVLIIRPDLRESHLYSWWYIWVAQWIHNGIQAPHSRGCTWSPESETQKQVHSESISLFSQRKYRTDRLCTVSATLSSFPAFLTSLMSVGRGILMLKYIFPKYMICACFFLSLQKCSTAYVNEDRRVGYAKLIQNRAEWVKQCCWYNSQLHCNENPIYVFPVKELRGLSPNFHIYVSVSDL